MPEYDVYRDSPLRFLGYANELAEAFRPIVHKYTVYSGYGLATGYVIADIVDKTFMASRLEEEKKKRKLLMTAIDVGIWQGLASLIIPSIVINRFSATSGFVMKRTTKIGEKRIKVICVIFSIALIPFIVKPIDHSVDYFMDYYVRDKLGTKRD